MFGKNIEITQASPHQECDYVIEDLDVTMEKAEEGGEEKWYNAYEVEDEFRAIVVELGTPDDIINAVEDEGWTVYEPTDEDVKKEQIKKMPKEVIERPAYYIEEPPKHRFEDVNRKPAEKFLKNRDRWESIARLEDYFYKPELDKFIARYTESDGDASRVVRHFDNLTRAEKELLLEDNLDAVSTGEGDDSGLTFHEVADRIHENAVLYERQSHLMAAAVEGDETHNEVKERINNEYGADLTYNDVAKNWYQMMDRMEEVAWLVVHCWPHIPEDQRTEEMEMILDSLDAEGDPREPEWFVEEE